MYEVERLATVLKPTQAFLDWLSKTPEQDPDLALEELQNDCTTLLLPAFETPDEADNFLRENINEIFTNELENWCEDESLWPEDRSFEHFTTLFDIEHNSMVFDMVEDDEDEDEDEGDDELEDDDDDFDDEDDTEEAAKA